MKNHTHKNLAIPNLKGCREVIKYSGLYVIDEKKRITYNKKTGIIRGV